MGVNSSRATRIPDSAENVALLRDNGDGAVTTTTTEPGVAIDQFTATLPGQGRDPFAMQIAAQIYALNATGDNAFRLEVWSDEQADGSDDPVTLLSVPIKTIGQFRLEVESTSIPENHAYLGIRAVLSGSSSPSLTYGANIVGARNHASAITIDLP